MKRPLIAGVTLLGASPALAHAGESHSGWTLDPEIVVPLGLLAMLYAVGAVRMARRSRTSAGKGQAALFAAVARAWRWAIAGSSEEAASCRSVSRRAS